MRLFILLVGLVCVFGQEEVVEVVAAEQEEVAAREDVAEDAPAQVVAAPGHLLPFDLQRALYEEEIARRIGGGVGLQLGPIGLGVGGGLGLGLGGGFTPTGFKFGGGAGLGNYGQ